jgi:hypothetical protein
MYIESKLLESYGQFFKNWKEYILTNYKDNSNEMNQNSETVIYWYNEDINKSTWDNPYFILICLIDNMVNINWIPLYWKSVNDNLIEIKFKNGKVLFINRLNKVIFLFN